MSPDSGPQESKSAELKKAILEEGQKFEEHYLWLNKHMPKRFFDEMDQSQLTLITHNLMNFHLQDFYTQIHSKHTAIVICLDRPEADLQILKHYAMKGIRYYRTFVSNVAPPFENIESNIRIGLIHFTEALETAEDALSKERKEELSALVKARNTQVTDKEFEKLIQGMNTNILKSMTTERLSLALDMFFRAKTRDQCQYEVRYNEDWQQTDAPSLQIVLAWRNAPKHNFLYSLARTILRHNLIIQRVAATYIDPHSTDSILILSMALHGLHGKAAWDEADIPDFLREIATLKYFPNLDDNIEKTFLNTNLLSGTKLQFVRCMTNFIHQTLVHADPNLYSLTNIEEGICRHPELIVNLCKAFEYKFHPQDSNLEKYQHITSDFLKLVEELDTGHAINDMRRKNILKQGLNFIEHTLKCNFYRNNKTSLMFRLDPTYLEHLPYDREDKFPEIPFAIFFCVGLHFLGFHIRFKDLSRGGLRTVITERKEQEVIERNNLFSECYNLAHTQHKKNKDIPEGGSKGVIFLEPLDSVQMEIDIYRSECCEAKISIKDTEKKIQKFQKEYKLEFLHQTQRSFTDSLISLVNCEDSGKLRVKNVIDYWKKPEYIYLGPDENMHDSVIDWIANRSDYFGYKPGRSFITGKPEAGINHKAYGVTSWGVNVYMKQALLYLGIDPEKDPFTVKISGGPDGDVAGNQIMNLYRYFRNTAKLLALTDVSGTIYDPEGLDLEEMAELFHKAHPIRYYPPEKLNEGGFLLDKRTRKEQTAYAQTTLCWKKENGKLKKQWLSGNEMNHLYRHNVHQAKTDVFIPGGGRPRTLNETNYKDFLDETNTPTSKAIIEGANLYLTAGARRSLEKLGVIIFKDSSCNKGGVICSSFEVLCSLALDEQGFLHEKDTLVEEILDSIEKAALNEATLMLKTHQQTQEFLTQVSDVVSERINGFKYHLLDYLETIELSKDPNDPLIRCLLLYCPPLLKEKYKEQILEKVPDIHKKAVIACYISSHLVYTRGLVWSPSIVDVLPLIAKDPNIVGNRDRKK